MAAGDPGWRLLTKAEVAEMLGVSGRTLTTLIRDGELRYVDVGHGKKHRKLMFHPSDVTAFIDQRRRFDPKPTHGKAAPSSGRPRRGAPEPIIGFMARMAELDGRKPGKKR